ncbi:MAG: hypothetical protein U0R64_08645 [Candidatus Nanopelagicales bacterium]
MPPAPRLLTVAVAAVEALLLIGYALSITWVVATTGLQGPQDVSSSSGVAVEITVFALFGIGCGLLAVGRWRGTDWATVPFAVVQLLALTVGIPLATGAGGGVPFGIVITAMAVLGLAALVWGRTVEPNPNRDAETGPITDARRRADKSV